MDDDKENKKKINIPTNEKNANLNRNPNNLESEDYQKYKINDITISSISYEDLDDKINRLINFKKEDNFKFETMNKEKDQKSIKEENGKKEQEKEKEIIKEENKKKEEKLIKEEQREEKDIKYKKLSKTLK